MNTYEVIALIAEPDPNTRFESIQRLASDALLPKPGTPQPRVTNFEKALTIGFGQTQLLVDGHHKVLIDDGTVYKLYNSLPKSPVPEYKIKSFEKKNGFTVLELDSTDLVDISDKMVVEMYALLPQPVPVPSVPNPATVKQPDYKALVTMLDDFVTGESTRSKLTEVYQKWVEQNM